MFHDIFWGVLLIVGGGELMTIEDPSLRDPWLPIVTPRNQLFSVL